MSTWIPLDSSGSLRLSHCDGVLRIVLDRPDVLNALDTKTSQALLDALQSAGADDSVRCVLITGAGRAFSAGADIGSQFGSEDARAVIEKEMRQITSPTILAIRNLPKPVVAAVNGPAAGVGCSIALAADVVLAAESAYFLLAFANIGLAPDGGASMIVSARVGWGRALVMALLAERVPATEAVSWGLADRLVPDGDLARTAEDLALRLAAGPTLSYAASKQAINRATLGGLEEALELEVELQGKLIASADFLEGTTAFAEKRRPRFTGR